MYSLISEVTLTIKRDLSLCWLEKARMKVGGIFDNAKSYIIYAVVSSHTSPMISESEQVSEVKGARGIGK